jgi:hypothetical protein
MFARFRSKPTRGVSLSEAMVSLLILTMVMIVALTLLFSMKSFAERQQVRTAPRQVSRRAIDYVSTYVAGATDLNDTATPPSPNAVVTWYSRPGVAAPVVKQASYNNLPLGSSFGEPGTDIITLAFPTSTEKTPFTQWDDPTDPMDWLDFRTGCSGADGTGTIGTEDMKEAFLRLSGATGASGAEKSSVLTVIDANNNWAYYQITKYDAFACGARSAGGDLNSVKVTADPIATERVDPVTGEPALVTPVFLCPGMRFFSFRVRRDGNGTLNLEQKQGLFDPDTDNPGTAFTPIISDVEDFQVAYLYSTSPDASGRTVFNTWDEATSSDVLVPTNAALPTGSGGVPYQGTGSLWDVTNVSGIRLSVTSRSAPVRFEARNISVRRGTATATNARPRSEDRPGAGPDDYEAPGASTGPLVGDFDHFRMTSTILIRNRMLGN